MSLKQAIKIQAARSDEIRRRLEVAVENICREVEGDGVLAIVTVDTTPEAVYGGRPRRVKARANVRFVLVEDDIIPRTPHI